MDNIKKLQKQIAETKRLANHTFLLEFTELYGASTERVILSAPLQAVLNNRQTTEIRGVRVEDGKIYISIVCYPFGNFIEVAPHHFMDEADVLLKLLAIMEL